MESIISFGGYSPIGSGGDRQFQGYKVLQSATLAEHKRCPSNVHPLIQKVKSCLMSHVLRYLFTQGPIILHTFPPKMGCTTLYFSHNQQISHSSKKITWLCLNFHTGSQILNTALFARQICMVPKKVLPPFRGTPPGGVYFASF